MTEYIGKVVFSESNQKTTYQKCFYTNWNSTDTDTDRLYYDSSIRGYSLVIYNNNNKK